MKLTTKNVEDALLKHNKVGHKRKKEGVHKVLVSSQFTFSQKMALFLAVKIFYLAIFA